ncbi:CPBP family intramembrane metalloprotease [Haloechinothrix sp. LS1_15]|nr:CPBP family intramembrane metalloprotease [Haloechinothrix sp. LS1_15]
MSQPGRATATRRAVTVVLSLALAFAVHVATIHGPDHIGWIGSPVVVVMLLVLARWSGLTWGDVGLSRRTWRSGAIYGGGAVLAVAVVYLAGVLLPATRSWFLDVRYDIPIGTALLTALVLIPLKTVLLEEIAFRGVLLGALWRPLGTAGAIGVSSILFGLWHIPPSLQLLDQNQALSQALGHGAGAQLLVVTGAVAFTTVAGLVFCELRRRSGSVLAPIGLHWATNGLGVLASAMLWAALSG